MKDGGQIVLGKFIGGAVLHEGLMIRSWEEQGSLANAFYSNLKTVNLNFFATSEGIYT